MEEFNKEHNNNKVFDRETFPVPYVLEDTTKNIIITNNDISKEKLINQAFKFHSDGNIKVAAKYYQYIINNGFKDYRVFSNFGAISI